jgi:uncharacterized membrane protein
MTRRKLLASLETDRVEAAIRHAEETCAIELRISIAGAFWGDPQHLAELAFRRMGMSATGGRNGLLIFLAPWRRKVVVIADEGIAKKVDAGVWSGLVASVTSHFRDNHFTDGLVAAIENLSAVLAPHLPPTKRVNELPDTIEG